MAATAGSPSLVPETELRELGVRAFEGLGLPRQDAVDVVDILVLADLFGLSTHGLSRIESYGERLQVGGINRQARIRVAHDSNLSADEVANWQAHLKDYEVAPLFQQFGKGTWVLPADKRRETTVTDFEGHLIESFALRGRTGAGVPVVSWYWP